MLTNKQKQSEYFLYGFEKKIMSNKDLNILEEKKLKTICRLCLIDERSLREISGTKLPSMIQYCLNIKILPHDQLPSGVCAKCFRQIMNLYTFKRRTEKNEIVLKKAIRNWSITKDIINIALEKSDINITELNKARTGDKIIKNIKNDDGLGEFENKVVNLYKSELCNDIQDFGFKPLGTIQGNQNSFCLNYNIEPPPLVPLHSNSTEKNNTRGIVKYSSLVSKNFLSASILEPPPLVPIEIVEQKNKLSKKLSCNTCSKIFGSLTDLKEHMKINCILNCYSCNICKKTYADQEKLGVHLIGHKNTKKEYLCNICGKRYFTRNTFIVHFRSHTGERPFNCNICGRGFVRWAGVKNHMKTHEDLRPYKCETCNKQFKVVSNLYRHQRLHSGHYTFSCNFCGKAFYQSEHLKLHIRTYHTHEKPYLCCECGKGFVSSQRLKRHEQVHSGQKPYPCTFCLKAYTSAIDLKNHNLKVHNKNGNRDELKKYVCSKCGLRFRHPCRLTNHMKIHSNHKICQACGDTFQGKQALDRHLKTCKNVGVDAQPTN